MGSGYVTVPSAVIHDTYIVSRIGGNAEGKYTSDMQEVTYYYTYFIIIVESSMLKVPS